MLEFRVQKFKLNHKGLGITNVGEELEFHSVSGGSYRNRVEGLRERGFLPVSFVEEFQRRTFQRLRTSSKNPIPFQITFTGDMAVFDPKNPSSVRIVLESNALSLIGRGTQLKNGFLPIESEDDLRGIHIFYVDNEKKTDLIRGLHRFNGYVPEELSFVIDEFSPYLPFSGDFKCHFPPIESYREFDFSVGRPITFETEKIGVGFERLGNINSLGSIFGISPKTREILSILRDPNNLYQFRPSI